MNRQKRKKLGPGPPLYQAAEHALTCLGQGELQEGREDPKGGEDIDKLEHAQGL